MKPMISTNLDEKSTTDWFLFEPTDDASLTMRFIHPETGLQSESMHSLRGAFSETDYIYGHAIRACIANNFTPRFLSVGLGLGYCEILLTALMLRENFECESFESDERLRSNFSAWIKGREIHPEFQKLYDQTLKSAAQLCREDAAAIKLALGSIHLRESLTNETLFTQKFSCVLFDAFSSKSSPELWNEEFLIQFFDKVCADNCVFATYACTGVLKRALRDSGFELEIRPGFSSKRDSTFAVRRGRDLIP